MLTSRQSNLGESEEYLMDKKKVNKTDFHETYNEHVRALKEQHSYDRAMQLAVGGEFEAMGLLERETLIFFGLKKDSLLAWSLLNSFIIKHTRLFLVVLHK